MRWRRINTRVAVAVAAVVVIGLVVAGVVLTVMSGAGSVGRELGPALLSGGIVGGALVVVESFLAQAAETRGEHEALVTLLSSNGQLNGIDLADRRLRNLYLPGRALVAARLERADLSGAKLYWGDMRACRLAGARLDGTDLSGSTLAGADLRDASLRGAILTDADLAGADLAGADLTGAMIDGAVLRNVVLDGANLSRATIVECFLDGADLAGARHLDAAAVERNQYDETTRWPATFVPVSSVEVRHEPISRMDLATYLAHRARRT